MRKFYVYVLTCPNEKRYVGCTTKRKPESRWQEGRSYQYNKCFYSDILKYGWDNITRDVFEVDSKEEMYRKEIELISFYHTNDPRHGYNHSIGGEKSALGCTRTEETRRKMSETRKGRPAWNKGKTLSEEARKHMSEGQKHRIKVKIELPDGTVLEISKQNLSRHYIKRGKEFEYVS